MKTDRDYLAHLLGACDWILMLVEECKTNLVEDERTQDSHVRKFEIIGEAANRLSSSLRDSSPDISWRSIISMRNRLIHQYFGVDLGLVWTTAT